MNRPFSQSQAPASHAWPSPVPLGKRERRDDITAHSSSLIAQTPDSHPSLTGLSFVPMAADAPPPRRPTPCPADDSNHGRWLAAMTKGGPHPRAVGEDAEGRPLPPICTKPSAEARSAAVTSAAGGAGMLSFLPEFTPAPSAPAPPLGYAEVLNVASPVVQILFSG